MHDIQPLNSPIPAKPLEPTGAVTGNKPLSQPAQICDTVEISTIAKLAAKVHQIPEVRAELVARVKTELAAGTYETTERIDVAVGKLMEELTYDL